MTWLGGFLISGGGDQSNSHYCARPERAVSAWWLDQICCPELVSLVTSQPTTITSDDYCFSS
jgi:hypothetical protein